MTAHNTNMYDWLLGPHVNEPNEAQMERWSAIVDAENAFEGIIGHVARTIFGENDDLKVRLALSAILGAWTCVQKAREAK